MFSRMYFWFFPFVPERWSNWYGHSGWWLVCHVLGVCPALPWLLCQLLVRRSFAAAALQTSYLLFRSFTSVGLDVHFCSFTRATWIMGSFSVCGWYLSFLLLLESLQAVSPCIASGLSSPGPQIPGKVFRAPLYTLVPSCFLYFPSFGYPERFHLGYLFLYWLCSCVCHLLLNLSVELLILSLLSVFQDILFGFLKDSDTILYYVTFPRDTLRLLLF